MPRTLPFLFALTLTACGTTESTVDDDNTSSNGAIASVPDTGMTTGSGSTDTGGGATDSSGVAPGFNGCEVYVPVLADGAPACPSECPHEYTLAWVGGCSPFGDDPAILSTRVAVRIGCVTTPMQWANPDGPLGMLFAFPDGAVYHDPTNGSNIGVQTQALGGGSLEPGSPYRELAEACGPLRIWEYPND